MILDAETLRWLIAGYFIGVAAVAGVAYNNPAFFLEWLSNKLMIAIAIVFMTMCAFWGGAAAVKDFVITKLSISTEQSQALLKSYDGGVNIIQLILAGAMFGFLLITLLDSLARARKKQQAD